MEQKKFDGRTASFKVSSVSVLLGGEGNDRYFSNLEDAKKYLDICKPMAEFRFGSDFYLYQKTGNTWSLVEKLGRHFQ